MASLNSFPSRCLPGLRGNTDGDSLKESAHEDHGLVSSFGPGQGSRAEDRANEARIVANMEDVYAKAEAQRLNKSAFGSAGPKPSLLRDALNTSHILSDGAAAIVDDSFLKCFTSMPADPWNWNAYLFPAWVLGLFLRHCILFPLRISLLLLANILFFPAFFGLSLFLRPGPRRSHLEQRLISWLCGAWMMAWCAVVKYHGPKPTPGPNKVWVANHTSMIDYTILCSHSPFAVIMQLHHGWVKFLQTRVLNCLGCLWFNRTDIKDRSVVAQRMKKHVSAPDSVPLLIFPEGTCVNNEYTVLFKRGAFELGAAVCPIAIKYNKIFVDAFWNSRRQSFSQHMLKLMNSWATVCDVWFLEPQHKGENETSDEFASRVQRMIADTAGLKVVPWDGYLKYYNLGQAKPGLIEKRRKVFGDVLRQHLPGGGHRAHSPNTTMGGEAPQVGTALPALEEGSSRWRGPPGAMPPPSPAKPCPSPWRGPCTVQGWGGGGAPGPAAPAPGVLGAAAPGQDVPEAAGVVGRQRLPAEGAGASGAGGARDAGVGGAGAVGAARPVAALGPAAAAAAAATTQASEWEAPDGDGPAAVAAGANEDAGADGVAVAEEAAKQGSRRQLRQRVPKTPHNKSGDASGE